jgi:general secretion pathway protein G
MLMMAFINIGCRTDSPKDPKVRITQATLVVLHEQVRMFKLDTGRFPTQEEGLKALVEKPSDVENWEPNGYLATTQIPKDAWGKEYVYQLKPESGESFVIISYGSDGQKGGEGYNADLYSTDHY